MHEVGVIIDAHYFDIDEDGNDIAERFDEATLGDDTATVTRATIAPDCTLISLVSFRDREEGDDRDDEYLDLLDGVNRGKYGEDYPALMEAAGIRVAPRVLDVLHENADAADLE